MIFILKYIILFLLEGERVKDKIRGGKIKFAPPLKIPISDPGAHPIYIKWVLLIISYRGKLLPQLLT